MSKSAANLPFCQEVGAINYEVRIYAVCHGDAQLRRLTLYGHWLCADYFLDFMKCSLRRFLRACLCSYASLHDACTSLLQVQFWCLDQTFEWRVSAKICYFAIWLLRSEWCMTVIEKTTWFTSKWIKHGQITKIILIGDTDCTVTKMTWLCLSSMQSLECGEI